MAKLEHIGINVIDIEKSQIFYNELFGFNVVKSFTSGEANISMIDIGGETLELVQRPGSPAVAHIAIHDPNFDETLAKLDDKEIKKRLVTMSDGSRICFFSDLDGHVIEITEKSF